jgi:hypothetical protein
LRAKATTDGWRDKIEIMKRWVRKLKSFEEERVADREFWAQLSPDVRVAAVEELRLQWSKIRGESHEGLRRTARVLKHAGS